MKLAMTIPIKNHAYLIKQNIIYHANNGVDCFVIMLHNSTDTSIHILEELSKSIEILYYRKNSAIFMDADFRTEMAFKAKNELGANWVITNDVDEFWVTYGNNINQNIHILSSVYNTIYAARYNFIPYVDGDEIYKSPPESFKYYVSSPKKIDKTKPFHDITPVEFMIKTNAGKAACALDGLQRISHGAHEVMINNYSKFIDPNTTIYHFPFSTPEVFFKETRDKIKSVLNDPTLQSNQNWHVKLLAYLVNSNTLEQFAQGLFPDKEVVEKLVDDGTVSKEKHLFDFFKQLSPKDNMNFYNSPI